MDGPIVVYVIVRNSIVGYVVPGDAVIRSVVVNVDVLVGLDAVVFLRCMLKIQLS